VPGEVLVKFSSTASTAERAALRGTLADRVLNRFDRSGSSTARVCWNPPIS